MKPGSKIIYQCHSRTFQRRSGFTIVELMVSLAIISVLMSLMAPALAMARETGRRMVCLSNLHTFGLAIHMYRDEHEGALPYSNQNFYALEAGWTDPIDALMPYLDVDPPRFDDEDRIVTGQPFRCPSDSEHADRFGMSYQYAAYTYMNAQDNPAARQAKAKYVTIHIYDTARRMMPIFRDQGAWHPGGPHRQDHTPTDRNSLRFDGSVGWSAEDQYD